MESDFVRCKNGIWEHADHNAGNQVTKYSDCTFDMACGFTSIGSDGGNGIGCFFGHDLLITLTAVAVAVSGTTAATASERDLQPDPASPLCELLPTQIRNKLHTLFVDIHPTL